MKRLNAIFLLVVIIGYLGTYNGKLCLYEVDKSQPVRIFPYSVTIFPKNDQTMLEQGISYSNAAELNSLIEDFIS